LYIGERAGDIAVQNHRGSLLGDVVDAVGGADIETSAPVYPGLGGAGSHGHIRAVGSNSGIAGLNHGPGGEISGERGCMTIRKRQQCGYDDHNCLIHFYIPALSSHFSPCHRFNVNAER